MSARGLGLVLLLLVLGVVGGYTYADLAGSTPSSDAAPTPLVASDPALPFTPPEKVNDDSDLPPVGVAIATHEETLGPPRDRVVVPVPREWDRVELGSHEARWTAPGNPPASYSVRVALLDENRSLAQQVAQRAAALPIDPTVTDVEIHDTSGDTLRATYVQSGYRRLSIIRWVSFSGGTADVEVAATGRLIDQAGLEELVARMASGVRRQRGGPS